MEVDEALTIIGFGWGQVIILIVCILLYTYTVTEAYIVGYLLVLTSCEFATSHAQMTLLSNAATTGMVLSGFFLGVFADRYGRKYTIRLSLISTLCCSLVSSIMPEVYSMVVIRFFVGIFLNAPASLTIGYLMEFYAPRWRPIAVSIVCQGVALGLLYNPGMGWALLPTNYSWRISSTFEFRTWRFYMWVITIPGWLGLVGLCLLPESPYFLMYANRQEKAFEALQWLCRLRRKKWEDLGILVPDPSTGNDERVTWKNFFNGTIRLFRRPVLRNFLVSVFFVFGLYFDSIGMGIWFPFIRNTDNKGSKTLCELTISNPEFQKMLKISANVTYKDEKPSCQDQMFNFFDPIMYALTYMVFFVVVSVLVLLLRRKYVMALHVGSACLMGIALNFINQPVGVLITFTLMLVVPGVLIGLATSVLADSVPVELRGNALCMLRSLSRIGAVAGSSLVGLLMKVSCTLTLNIFVMYLAGMTDIDEAYAQLGFGRMQLCAFFTCFLIQFWITNEQLGFSLVLIMAHCDLRITDERIAWLMGLNFGAQMVLSLVWGEMMDRHGRRRIMLISGPICLSASVLSAFMPEFWSFLAMRVVMSAFLSGPIVILMTYMGELSRISLRPKVLNYLSYSIGFSMIFVAIMAAILLQLKMGSVSSWRVLHLVNTIPGICGMIAMVFLPESPKYYLSVNQEAKALKVLERICRRNKGKDVTLDSLGIESLTQPRLQTQDKGRCTQAKTLMTRYLNYMVLMSFSFLIVCGVAISLHVWMLRIRVVTHSQKEDLTVCEHMHKQTTAMVIKCDLPFEELMDALIHGFVVLSFFIFTSLLLYVLSRRMVISVYILIAIGGGLFFNFVRNPHVMLLCFFALIDPPMCCIRLALSLVIDLIPTHLRGKALSFVGMMGRLGVMLVNLFVGYTLRWNCHVTFNTLVGCLMVSSVLVFMLPSERRVKSLLMV